MKKKTLIFSIVAILIVGLTSSTLAWWIFGGDDKEATSDENYKIAVVLKALNSDYWKSVKAGAEAAAEKYGVELAVVGPSSETQVMQQINLLEDQLTRGSDILVVAPLRPKAVLPVFNKANEQGIPILTIDTDVSFENKVAFVGTGNFQAAEKGGKYTAKKVNKGKVAIIRGAMGDYIHDQRVNGFKKGIAGSGLEVVTIQPANSSRGKAVNVTQNIIQAYPDITAIYATNDEMALGVVRAIKGANLGHDIFVMGFDGAPDAIKSIKSGELTATIKQDSYGIGYMGVENAVKHLNSEQVDKVVPVPTSIVDKDNINESIKDLAKAFSMKRLREIFGNDLIDEVFNK